MKSRISVQCGEVGVKVGKERLLEATAVPCGRLGWWGGEPRRIPFIHLRRFKNMAYLDRIIGTRILQFSYRLYPWNHFRTGEGVQRVQGGPSMNVVPVQSSTNVSKVGFF